MSIADLVAVVEYGVAFLALVGFVVGYLATSHGRALRSPEGRHMLVFRGSLAAWMALGVIWNVVDDFPGREWVRNAVIGVFMLSALGGNWLMVRAQRRARALQRLAAQGRGERVDQSRV